jgi:hypothetical protein
MVIWNGYGSLWYGRAYNRGDVLPVEEAAFKRENPDLAKDIIVIVPDTSTAAKKEPDPIVSDPAPSPVPSPKKRRGKK